MALTFTVTEADRTLTFTVREGVGPAGPNNITTSTSTNGTGVLKGDGSTISFQSPTSDGDANPETVLQTDANGDIKFTSLEANHADFSGSNPASVEGRVYYDATEKTHCAVNDITTSTLNIGHEAWVRVVNNTGSPITDGQAVYINGNDVPTGLPTIALAQADSSATANVLGVTTVSIADGAEGLVTAWGKVRDLNTSAFGNGDLLYLSPSVAGGFTNVKPTRPDRIVEIGFVTK
ncbi:MAG TPA: hypothetical protein V6D20_11835, partial [Candidatus Obscuribacterales bacterium]